MADYLFREILREKPDFSNRDHTFIWVWNADKIPPHLGFSFENNYYSLTFKERELKPVSGVLRKATRSKIPLLFVEIPGSWEETEIRNAFQLFERAEAGKSTCLSPIREVLGLNETIQQLAHLLTELDRQGIPFRVFALHLDQSYVLLPDYTVDDIVSRIQGLNHAER